MALTPSTMLPLGTKAPFFQLNDTDGKVVSLNDFQGASALVVAFICNHCPFVKHIRDELARFGRDMQAQGVAVVAISSNDIGSHPADSPEKMADEKRLAGYTFPYLFDADQSVAAAYHAACTPDFYLFDGNLELVYRGQLDDSRPGNGLPVTGHDLRNAVVCLLEAKPLPVDQKPSIGCNIKWTPGREPEYAR
jgi:peroxiredoxin